MSELTKRVAAAWRDFIYSAEGQAGLAHIKSQRPPLNDRNWQKAAGFEEFEKRLQEVLDFELPEKETKAERDPDRLEQ